MSLPRTMKAAVVPALGAPLDVREVPVPEVRPGEVLIRVRASGVCHTDLHAAMGDWPVKPSPPFIPGHEGVGEVTAVGTGVTRPKESDRVGAPWLHTVRGRRSHCVGGRETLCESQQNTCCSVDGGYAEFVRADANAVGALPDGIDAARLHPCWATASPSPGG